VVWSIQAVAKNQILTKNMNDTNAATPPRPQRFTARFEDKIIFNEKYVEYSFELIEPSRMSFIAGQYISVKVSDDGQRRPYSITSSPSVDHGFALLLDLAPAGVGSKYFESLKFGDTVDFVGPMGVFFVNQQASQPIQENSPTQETSLALVATGSGIAPMRSIILDQLHNRQDHRPITLYWGMRYVQELFWVDEFEEIVESYPNFAFHPVISKAIEAWPLCRGRVTDCLSIHQIDVTGGYYLCGSSDMVRDLGSVLLHKNVPAQRIYYEKFF
jgi:Na+-transporting NADH:ubiquinone oxidoreductase subunit F